MVVNTSSQNYTQKYYHKHYYKSRKRYYTHIMLRNPFTKECVKKILKQNGNVVS